MRRRNRESRGGIERKILTSILWVGVLPMAIALITGYTFAHEAQRLFVQQNLATAAQKTADGLLLALNARMRAVGTLSRDAEIVGALSGPQVDIEALRKRLQIESKATEDGEAVINLYDIQGNLVVSTHDSSQQEKRLSAWQRAIGEPRFIDFAYHALEFRYTARIVAPVYSRETAQPIGYVTEIQGVNSLLRYALVRPSLGGENRVGSDTYQVVYAVRGGLLTSYFDEETDRDPPPLKFRPAHERLQNRIRSFPERREGSFRINDYDTGEGNLDVLLAYHRLFLWDEAYIVVYRPAAAVFANINLGALLALIGSVLVIAFFCVIAYRNVHNNIVRPIALLNEGAQIIRQGDLDLKLRIETRDEIEQLASSFNEMARALKHNIRQLEDSEGKYRGLITSMRDGVCQADPSGTITFMNPAGRETLGFDEDHPAEGVSLRELFQDEKDYTRIVEDLAGRGFIERTRLWMRRRDGVSICVELTVNRVFDDNGQFIGEEGIFRDVTKSVQLEREARERSERIHAINQIANAINSSLEAGRLYESIAAEVRKLVEFDCATVTLLREEADAFEIRRLWPEPGGEPEEAALSGVDGSCMSWVAENAACLLVEDLQVDGAPRAGRLLDGMRSCLCVPLYANNQIIGSLNLGAKRPGAFSRREADVLDGMAPHVAVAIRNAQLLDNLKASLDEVTQARERLHEVNEELKTLDEMKTNLLSNVSHELRTPLVSVMGYTDMILNERVGPLTDSQRKYLTISLRNIDKLVTLIENLLDFSRLHRGAEEMVFDVFDLTECARSSIQIVQPVADGRNVTLMIEGGDVPIEVEGDKSKLGQVFNNLLSNAIKFNHTGGSVVIEIWRNEGMAEVAVRDTGIGIPADALDKVFTRFYQVDASSTRKYGGTGIGLAIAQDIVRLHGSRISVTSEPGKGSVFRFALPMSGVKKRPRLPHSEEPACSPETHLLVELVSLDLGLAAHLRKLLTADGLELIHASGPDCAADLARKYRPDCMLVDVEPENKGEAMLDELLSHVAVSERPVVLLTNSDALYETYRNRVASRIKRGFRKSSLLSGIRYAVDPSMDDTKALGNAILCVDDDKEIVEFIRVCLETEGYTVACCASGDEAVRLVKGHEYRLVLLDLTMPGMDGWETCRRIKAEPGLAGIKVYFVTAKPIDGTTPELHDSAVDGYLLKPFKPDDLLQIVQGFMGSTDKKEA